MAQIAWSARQAAWCGRRPPSTTASSTKTTRARPRQREGVDQPRMASAKAGTSPRRLDGASRIERRTPCLLSRAHLLGVRAPVHSWTLNSTGDGRSRPICRSSQACRDGSATEPLASTFGCAGVPAIPDAAARHYPPCYPDTPGYGDPARSVRLGRLEATPTSRPRAVSTLGVRQRRAVDRCGSGTVCGAASHANNGRFGARALGNVDRCLFAFRGPPDLVVSWQQTGRSRPIPVRRFVLIPPRSFFGRRLPRAMSGGRAGLAVGTIAEGVAPLVLGEVAPGDLAAVL
jgi:hypothetical protein